jgi:cell division control protein 7
VHLKYCSNAETRPEVWRSSPSVAGKQSLTDAKAIDVWAVGMILSFFLTNKFPLLNSGDDVEALMEIACIIGRRKMEKVATLHSTYLPTALVDLDVYLTFRIGRTFSTNIPTLSADGISWTSFVEKMNPNIRTPRPPDPRFFPYYPAREHPPPPSSPSSRISPTSSDVPGHHSTSPGPQDEADWSHDVNNALDLLEKIMNPESVKRWTPLMALRHPFLSEDSVNDDDTFPHPFGFGVCGDWHLADEYDHFFVRIRLGEGDEPLEDDEVDDGDEKLVIRQVAVGEGVAIGNAPCEFHRDEPLFRGKVAKFPP